MKHTCHAHERNINLYYLFHCLSFRYNSMANPIDVFPLILSTNYSNYSLNILFTLDHNEMELNLQFISSANVQSSIPRSSLCLRIYKLTKHEKHPKHPKMNRIINYYHWTFDSKRYIVFRRIK